MSGPDVEQTANLAPFEVHMLYKAYRAHRCRCGVHGCLVGHSALSRLLSAGYNPATRVSADDDDGFALGPSES